MRWRRAWLVITLAAAATVGIASPSWGDAATIGEPVKAAAPTRTTAAAKQAGAEPGKDGPVAAAGGTAGGEGAKVTPGGSAGARDSGSSAGGGKSIKTASRKDPELQHDAAVELDWKPLWALDVTEGAAWSSGPIAVRGRLMVVPSFGRRVGEADNLDGALVVDGKTGELVRRITVPRGDATGVALDGDHVVVSAQAGHVVKARLDGLQVWSVPLDGPLHASPTLADLNADRILDVIVPIGVDRCDSGSCEVGLMALDGSSGAGLWGYRIEAGGPFPNRPDVVVLPGESGALRVLLRRGSESLMEVEIGVDKRSKLFGRGTLPDGALPTSDAEFVAWFEDAGRKSPKGTFMAGAVPRWELGSLSSTAWFAGDPETTVSIAEATRPSAAPVLAVRTSESEVPARVRAFASIASPLSLGDVDEDGVWDAVLIADGKLQAFPTGERRDVMFALPRGDLRNTGMLPPRRESIDSYRSRIPARDTSWWLARQPKAVGSDFQDISAKKPLELAVAAPNGSLIPIPASALDAARVAQRRTITVNAAGATVCFGKANCAEVPSPRPLAHVTMESIDERAWALATDGTLLLHRRGTGRWDVVEAAKDPGLVPASVERLLAVPGAVAILAPARTTLIQLDEDTPDGVHGLTFRASDLVHCGERWFANNEGRLVAAFASDLGRWAMVPEHPGPVRRLYCSGRDLEVETGMNRRFLLAAPPPPSTWAQLLWLPVALLLVAVGLATARLFTTPKDPVDKKGDVRRRFGFDVPIKSKEQAGGAQWRLAEGLIDFIDNPDTQPPLTIAVCGSWGSGKSSVMNVINAELASTGRHILVWFNAWRFHREEDIARAFYQTILDEFRRQAGFINRVRVTWTRVRRAGLSGGFRFLATTSAILAVIGLFVVITQQAIKANAPKSFASAWPVVVGIIATIAGAWTKLLSPALKVVNVDPEKMFSEITGRLRFVQDLKAEFETVFSGLKDTMKLVIFVDDLDRCPPERVTDMLEALNVLADTGHCVLVLAMEKRAVERAVEVRFKDLIDHMEEEGEESAARSYGARYIEKMVTVSVNVPSLDAASVIGGGEGRRRPEVTSGPAPRRWYEVDAKSLRRRLIDAGAALGVAVALFFVAQSVWRTVPQGFAKDPGKQLYAWFCDAGAFLAGLDATLEGKSGAQAEGAAKPGNAAAAEQKSTDDEKGTADEKNKETGAKGNDSRKSDRKSTSTAQTPAPSASVLHVDIPPQADPAGERSPAATPLAGTESPDPLVDEQQRISRRESAIRAVLLLALVAVLAGFLAFRARLREIGEARRMAHDSAAFSDALERSAADLPPNPRNAIRFANLARFLYYLVRKAAPPVEQRDSATSGEHAQVELLFCKALVAYWTTGTPRFDGMPPWLKKELGAWLGATEAAGQPKTVAAE
jgi:hypothetical protein